MVDELFERFRGEMLDCLLFTDVTTTINAGDRQLTRHYSATLRMSDLDRAVRQQSRRPAAAPPPHIGAQLLYISCMRDPQQQTRRTLLQRSIDGTHRRTSHRDSPPAG